MVLYKLYKCKEACVARQIHDYDITVLVLYSVVAHMSPVHGLYYHLSVSFCVSVFTDDGGRMAIPKR